MTHPPRSAIIFYMILFISVNTNAACIMIGNTNKKVIHAYIIHTGTSHTFLIGKIRVNYKIRYTIPPWSRREIIA